MKSFKNYIDENELNEMDISTVVIMSALGIPVAGIAAYGGSLLLKGYSKFLAIVLNKIIFTWKDIFKNIKTIGKKEVIDVINDNKKNSYVKKYINEGEKTRRIYEEELNKVYKAIESKDFDKANVELKKVDKKISNNLEVRRMIISEISSSLKEPPLHLGVTGNKTYKAIKKILDIKTAAAAAEATKLAIEKGLK